MTSEERTWRIEIINRDDVVDAVGRGVCEDIRDLGVSGIERVRYIRLYALRGAISPVEAELIAVRLLADPITQTHHCLADNHTPTPIGAWSVEVWPRPGVTDAVGETTLKGARDLGVSGVVSAATGRGYLLAGQLSEDEVIMICRRLLANEVIERYGYQEGR